MKLSKKEVSYIRELAYEFNVLNQNIQEKLEAFLTTVSSKKVEEAKKYFEYLTENVGKKTYTVDFNVNGSGYLNIHNCTHEEAISSVIFKLQNGAFGRYEKLEDIEISNVKPETIYYNTYENFLKWKEEKDCN